MCLRSLASTLCSAMSAAVLLAAEREGPGYTVCDEWTIPLLLVVVPRLVTAVFAGSLVLDNEIKEYQ